MDAPPIPATPDGTPPPAGLPGASLDPGTGPVVPDLFEGLIEDTPVPEPAGRPLDQAVRDHVGHRRAWYGPLLGPLALPVSAVGGLSAALDAASVPPSPTDEALAVVLVAAGPGGVAAGTIAGLDRRVRLAGLEVMAEAGEAGTLPEPVWIEIPRGSGMAAALARAAVGGRQNVAFHVDGPAPPGHPEYADDAELAAFLRQAIDLDLAFRLCTGPGRAVRRAGPGRAEHGVLNVLCGVRAALNGAETPEVAEVLAEYRPEPLASGARRISDADAAVLRAFCHSVGCAAVRRWCPGWTRSDCSERPRKARLDHDGGGQLVVQGLLAGITDRPQVIDQQVDAPDERHQGDPLGGQPAQEGLPPGRERLHHPGADPDAGDHLAEGGTTNPDQHHRVDEVERHGHHEQHRVGPQEVRVGVQVER